MPEKDIPAYPVYEVEADTHQGSCEQPQPRQKAIALKQPVDDRSQRKLGNQDQQQDVCQRRRYIGNDNDIMNPGTFNVCFKPFQPGFPILSFPYQVPAGIRIGGYLIQQKLFRSTIHPEKNFIRVYGR